MANRNRQFIVGVGWLATVAVVGLFTWMVIASPEQAIEQVERVTGRVTGVEKAMPEKIDDRQTIDRSSAFNEVGIGTPVTENAVYAAVMTPEKQGYVQGAGGTVIETSEGTYLLVGEEQIDLASKPIYLKSHPQSGLVKLQTVSLSQVESNWLGRAYERGGLVAFIVVEEGK